MEWALEIAKINISAILFRTAIGLSALHKMDAHLFYLYVSICTGDVFTVLNWIMSYWPRLKIDGIL